MLRTMGKVGEPSTTPRGQHPAKGQLVGYVRVSTFDQNETRQLESVRTDCVFTDKASGKDVIVRSSPRC